MPSTDTYLTWDGTIGYLKSGGIDFITTDKFEFSFDYNTLYYEPQSGNSFKTLSTSPDYIQLSAKEIAEILKQTDEFISRSDYNVRAHSNRLYVGEMLKSEAIAKEYEYTHIPNPEHSASKLVTDPDGKEHWEKIKMIVYDDGHIALDPPGLCMRCVFGYTAAEYLLLPEQPTVHHKWDLTTNSWYDPRELSAVKHAAKLQVRTDLDVLIWKTLGEYIPQYHMATWAIQVEEAEVYQQYKLAIKTNSKTPQPDCVFLRTFLDARTDQDKPTLSELAEDVLRNSKLQREVSATIMARQWFYLKKIDQLTTIKDVDNLLAEFVAEFKERVDRVSKT